MIYLDVTPRAEDEAAPRLAGYVVVSRFYEAISPLDAPRPGGASIIRPYLRQLAERDGGARSILLNISE